RTHHGVPRLRRPRRDRASRRARGHRRRGTPAAAAPARPLRKPRRRPEHGLLGRRRLAHRGPCGQRGHRRRDHAQPRCTHRTLRVDCRRRDRALHAGPGRSRRRRAPPPGPAVNPTALGVLGIAVMLLLMALRVPIGVAMGVVGFAGFASLNGWSAALAILGLVPYGTVASFTLTVLPLFV